MADQAQADAADTIVAAARAGRRRPSRGVWIVALGVGVACTIAFIVVLLSSGSPTAIERVVHEDRGLSFPVGLLIGLVVGAGIGFAIARQRHPVGQGAASHSDRSKP